MEPERHDTQDDQDGTRFWREEREEGAVYHAYLKRVTYLSQARLEDETAREFSHLMWETQKVRVIQAGTLPRLVESLASHCRGELDSSHMNVLLSTYRTFATPRQLLDAIIHRYQTLRSHCKVEKSEQCEQQQKTFRCVLSVWLDKFPEDFREPPDFFCLKKLESFGREVIPDSDLATKAQQRMDSFRKEQENKEETIHFRFSICDEVDHMMEVPRPLSFNDIEPRMCAEQLTLRDAELFRKVVPHYCLGSVWGRRDKKGGGKEEACYSVQATVDQFNRVSLRVIATVLRQRDLKASTRAKILLKWINVAQELRELKNFSSLRAILSGLQSHPVYRLRKCWAAVPKETVVLFEELSDIFSGDNNQLNSRELLMKEATAKFPDLESQNKTLKRKNLQKRRSWIDNGTVQGTVPYLGTFLTDLTMLDTALPDMTEDGLINFEKRRREFQVLAQLRLLQSAAQIYTLQFEPRFWVWFDSLRTFTETESHEMSCAIEPPSESVAKIKKKSARLTLCIEEMGVWFCTRHYS